MPTLISSPRPRRCARPSLLDARFCGDPWIEPSSEGTAALCLANYCLADIALMPFDLPSLNETFHRMRVRLPVRRARGRAAVGCG
jgi:hypothetical protein